MFRTYTIPEALAELAELHSHDALEREAAEALCEPFQFVPALYKEKANTSAKGLWNPDVPAGTVVEVVAVYDLVQQIAHQLNLAVAPSYGRGAMYRNALQAIQQHYSTTTT